jgi:hypothetical protein
MNMDNMDPYQKKVIECKEQIDRLPCYLSPLACKKGKVLLWDKCVKAFLQENTVSKMATCSAVKGGGGNT